MISDDSVREGMFYMVADSVFGTGSFNCGVERSRFSGLFARESRLASDLEISWKHLPRRKSRRHGRPKGNAYGCAARRHWVHVQGEARGGRVARRGTPSQKVLEENHRGG
jgi:hypothetical protein